MLQYGVKKGRVTNENGFSLDKKKNKTKHTASQSKELKLHSLILAWVKSHQNCCLWIALWSFAKMDAVQLQHSFNEKWHRKSRVCSCSRAAHESWDLGYGKSYWLWHLLGNEISIAGFKLRYLRMLLYLKQVKGNFDFLLQTENDWIIHKYILQYFCCSEDQVMQHELCQSQLRDR